MNNQITINEEKTHIKIEAETLNIEAYYDEYDNEWIVTDGYETERHTTREDMVKALEDMVDFYELDTDLSAIS